jgi:ribosomal subunit interface protein
MQVRPEQSILKIETGFDRLGVELKDVLLDMQIQITGKNLDIGDALREHVENRINNDVAKYFDGIVRAHVIVEKQRSGFDCEITLHLTTGLTLNGQGSAGDAHGAADTASGHLEKRLRRYKRRLKNHHLSRKEPVAEMPATAYVLQADETEGADEPEDLNPVIVAESTASIAELSVGEAVMQLDFTNEPFVLFRNGRNGSLNVVYKRKDGNVGWVDPGAK